MEYLKTKTSEMENMFEFAVIIGLQVEEERKKCCPIVLFQHPKSGNNHSRFIYIVRLFLHNMLHN